MGWERRSYFGSTPRAGTWYYGEKVFWSVTACVTPPQTDHRKVLHRSYPLGNFIANSKPKGKAYTIHKLWPYHGNRKWHLANTAIQPTPHMYLGLLWGTTWVYTTYGLCSAPRLAHRCSEKDGPNRHSLSMRRNTQVESHNKTVGPQHGRSKQPCWWDSSFINLTGLKN
jgi:hypothetical protein